MRKNPDLIFQVITKLRMKFLIVLVFYLISSSEAMQLEPEEVTLDGIYNFFSDDFTTKKFYVQIVMQAVITSVGWLVAHEVWRIFHPETETEVRWDELANYVLDDEGAVDGVIISMGYGIVASILTLGLSQIANPISRKRQNDVIGIEKAGWFDGFKGNIEMGENLEIFERQTEDDDQNGISIYNDVLPKVMSRTNIYTMILLQVVYNVPSFLFFWFLMDLM